MKEFVFRIDYTPEQKAHEEVTKPPKPPGRDWFTDLFFGGAFLLMGFVFGFAAGESNATKGPAPSTPGSPGSPPEPGTPVGPRGPAFTPSRGPDPRQTPTAAGRKP